jgi:hypothetical protein
LISRGTCYQRKISRTHQTPLLGLFNEMLQAFEGLNVVIGEQYVIKVFTPVKEQKIKQDMKVL